MGLQKFEPFDFLFISDLTKQQMPLIQLEQSDLFKSILLTYQTLLIIRLSLYLQVPKKFPNCYVYWYLCQINSATVSQINTK